MKNILWKVLFIIALLAGSVWLVFPPKEKLRLGRDLTGGTSLVYSVKIPENVDAENALNRVIQVLSNRVNPKGVLDISFVPVGRDRIEVVMPLPGEEVKSLKAALDQVLADLQAAAEIKPADLDAELAQGTAATRFGSASPGESSKIEQLQAMDTQRHAAQQALQEAEARGASDEERMPLEQALADAEVAFTDLRAEVLAQSLSRLRVIAVLGLSNVQRLDKSTGERVPGSSPREEALARLSSDFPNLDFSKAVNAYDAYTAKRRGLDEPEDLIRLLRGAGVLEFHIAVTNSDAAKPVNVDELRQQLQDRGPEGTDTPVAKWFPINDVKQWYEKPGQLAALEADPINYFAGRDLVAAVYDNRYFLLLYMTEAKSLTHSADKSWTIERTYATSDQLGRPAVGFILDSSGGQYMGRLTGPNVNQPMAIVLDGQVYSAPNIQERIGGQGQITGSFSSEELKYLTLVLAAGSLEARLAPDPIAINTLGPSLGADNLIRGSQACIISVIITAVIMVVYYFFAGAIAVIALLANALMTFGLMALVEGTFTLPGLAGIALSTSMAVDANVLIYERIREELVNNKEKLRDAIRLGYQRALRAIIDGNMTHLIVCVVLMYTATTEVKGFALTMIMGVAATLFTAIFVTRVMYTLYTDFFKFKSLPMLPIAFPAIHRALQPHVNWIRLRPVFLTISGVAIVASVALLWHRGAAMLDTEFRGGVAATMKTRADVSLSRAEVEQAIHELGEQAGPGNPVLHELRNASVLTLGQTSIRNGQVYSSQFQIKVASPKGIDAEDVVTDEIVNAIVARFTNELDAVQPLGFDGMDNPDEYLKHTRPISHSTLGEVIDRSEFTQPVREFSGGVAVMVESISPPATVDDLAERIKIMRAQPDFTFESSRTAKVIGLDPADPAHPAAGFTSAVVLVLDPDASYHKVDPTTFERKMEQREWQLVSQALQRRTGLEQVSSFSSAVAETLEAQAAIAVLLCLLGMLAYIWVRFGSLRYSLATVAALAHNVIISLGALALTHTLAGTVFASSIRLDEFRIDLNVLAALLTIIGYSINDTIVILDRVRENRGKRLFASPQIVNDSINQTFSRTMLTGGSTILASIVLYWIGGPGLQPFAYTFFVGLLVGTYSSVVIAAPLVVKAPPESGSPQESSTSRTRLVEKESWKDQTATAPA